MLHIRLLASTQKILETRVNHRVVKYSIRGEQFPARNKSLLPVRFFFVQNSPQAPIIKTCDSTTFRDHAGTQVLDDGTHLVTYSTGNELCTYYFVCFFLKRGESVVHLSWSRLEFELITHQSS